MTTVLLTLGRLPKALDLARGFARIGCRVIVAEPFPRHLAGASNCVARNYVVPAPNDDREAYLASLLKIIMDEAVDWVIPVSEETVHAAYLRDRLPLNVTLFTMPPDRVLALYDKRRFIEVGQEYGVAVPETYRLGSTQAADMAAARDVVVKPIFSCSGRGLAILRRGEALPAPDPDDPAIVQSFVPGTTFSTCSIARDGRVIATAIYRGTLMSGTVAVAFVRVDDQSAISSWIDRFVAASGWTGFISFDFIRDNSGTVFAIECNPRTTSGVHFWEPEDVAKAVLDTTGETRVRNRPEATFQQFYSCLTETQMALFRGDHFLERLKQLFTTRDVTWDRRDPWPFLGMILNSWHIIMLSIRRRSTFGEVATLDISWRERA